MRFIALSLIFIFAAAGARSAAGQARVANFGLKDQNDQYTEVNFPSDRLVVLIFGDRKGADQIGGWSGPLYSKYSDRVYLFGVASLNGVPTCARGLVRRLIKRQTSYPVLLDWGGKVADGLGYKKGSAFVVLVGKDGTMVSKRSGAATSSEIEALSLEISGLL